MKSLTIFAIFAFALGFCNLGNRLKEFSSDSSSSESNSATTTGEDSGDAESPELTASQKAIADAAVETNWGEQGISWKLPASWKKMNVMKESFDYASPDNAFLLASISVLSDSFPSAISLTASYESALEQLRQGKYENVRYLVIDGVKGVEWWEAMPEDKSGPRRHQWIAFRRYQGQNQQLNIMLSTAGSNFDKHRDDFAAIMYSMKIPKG